MNTPKRIKKCSNKVNAPFKSPLKPLSDQNQTKTFEPSDLNENVDEQAIANSLIGVDQEIEHYTDLLLNLEPNENGEVNLDEELSAWRRKMHEYNEAKDTCLILFGHIAHHKQCLVREVYAHYGMQLAD